jgi:hypothetical protein
VNPAGDPQPFLEHRQVGGAGEFVFVAWLLIFGVSSPPPPRRHPP